VKKYREDGALLMKHTNKQITSYRILDSTISNADISSTAAIDPSKLDIKCGETPVAGSATFASGLSTVTHVSASLKDTPDDDASFAVGLTGANGNITLKVYKTAAAGGFTLSSTAKQVTWSAWRTKAT